MKLLHTADWHLGRRLEGKSRHDEQVAVLKEICAVAESEDVDGVLVTGDIYDSYNPPAESEALFYTTAARLSGRRWRTPLTRKSRCLSTRQVVMLWIV